MWSCPYTPKLGTTKVDLVGSKMVVAKRHLDERPTLLDAVERMIEAQEQRFGDGLLKRIQSG
jgi:hypothetical protein